MMVEALFRPTPLPVEVATGATLLFLIAQVLRFWALRTLGSYWNISVLTTDGFAPRFVADGPYRFIRHPNYLVVIVEIATLPLVGGAVWTSILFSALNGIVLYRRIPLEESHLFRIPGYREVMGMKGRFFPTKVGSRQ
jgi:methyltransferase